MQTTRQAKPKLGSVHHVVLPFGGAKGAALSMLMEILCGVLTGAAFAGEVKNPYTDTSGPQNVGHFFIALKPNLFVSQEDYEERMDTLIERSKSSSLAAGFDEIMMTGEPERRTEQKRYQSGISLTPDVVQRLRSEAQRVSLNWNRYN